MSERTRSKKTRGRNAPARERDAKGAGTAERGPRRASAVSLTTGWASAVLALLVVLFFHEVVLGGKTFVSPDATAPVGFVRMGEQALYEERTYPLWNPYVFLGMPSFASGAYNPLIYPPDWPLAIAQKVLPLPDLTWLLLYYLLGGVFTFLLAREWGARAEGALLGAAVFVFAPNLVAVGSHGHGSQLVNSAYLPLMLWLGSRWLKRGGVHHLGWLALAGGFQMLRGHVQIVFYTWIALGLLVLVELVASLRRQGEILPRVLRAAGVGVSAALAFGLAAFYNLPLRDYAKHSIRGGGADGGVGFDYATAWSMAPYELPAIVLPNWVGFGGQTYWGGMPFTDYPNAFMGIVAILLIVPAFFAGATRTRVFAMVLAGVSLAISFGSHSPVYAFLYEHLPLFNKFRVPVMIVLLFQIAVALGLAWGWSAVLDARDAKTAAPRMQRLLVVAGAVVAGLAVIGILFQDAWREAYVRTAMATRERYSPELGALAFGDLMGDLGRAAFLGLAALGAALLALKRRLSITLATLIVLALALVDLWPVSGRVMEPVIGERPANVLEMGRDDVVQFLEQAGPPGSFRILPLEEFQGNRFAGFGIASVGGYHAAKTRLVQDYFDRGLQNDLAWMRLLNVRYIVTRQPVEPLPPFLREVYRGSSLVYENLAALPRAMVLGAYEVVQPPAAIFDSVRAGADPALVTRLEKDPGLALGPVEGATATITRYGLNDVELRVSTPGPGLLRLADLWYPDWTATVDGEPAEVLKADYLLRAVHVPAGEHAVVFRFESPALRTGLTVSLASLAVILLLLGGSWWAGRRARTRSGDGPAPAEGAGAPAAGSA